MSWLFFSGCLIRNDDIPVYWAWFQTIVPVSYAFKAQLANQFGSEDPTFTSDLTVLQVRALLTRAFLALALQTLPKRCFQACAAWLHPGNLSQRRRYSGVPVLERMLQQCSLHSNLMPFT